jgi:archaellum component FlaC
MSYSDENEIVWLPKKLAEQVKEVTDEKRKELLILRFIEDSKIDLQASLESLDEDVVRYKGSMIRARKAFEEAKNEQLNANYELWKKFDAELPSVEAKVQTLTKKLHPLKKELEEIKELMNGIRDYDIKLLLELVKNLHSYLNYDSDTSKILRFLFENYKKEQK